jgi:catalase
MKWTGSCASARKRLQLRQTALFYKADPEYGELVAKGLGLKVKEV